MRESRISENRSKQICIDQLRKVLPIRYHNGAGQTIFIIFFTLFSLGSPCHPEIALGAFEVKSFRWSGSLEEGRSVNTANPYGDIRVRNSKRGGIGVSAIIQNLVSGQAVPDVRVIENASGYNVIVNMPSDEEEKRGYKGRVDLTLLLPERTLLTAKTTHGNIFVRMKGAANVDTESGNLSINITGNFHAKTKSGNITAWIKGMIGNQPIRIESITGNITVKVSDQSDVIIHAASGGTVNAYPAPGGEAPVLSNDRALTWKLGSHSRKLEIISISGDIQIYASKPMKSQPKTGTAPTMLKKDLSTLPRTQPWRPGQPIKEVPKG